MKPISVTIPLFFVLLSLVSVSGPLYADTEELTKARRQISELEDENREMRNQLKQLEEKIHRLQQAIEEHALEHLDESQSTSDD